MTKHDDMTQITEKQRRVLCAVAKSDGHGLTLEQIADQSASTPKSARAELTALEARGAVVRHQPTPNLLKWSLSRSEKSMEP